MDPVVSLCYLGEVKQFKIRIVLSGPPEDCDYVSDNMGENSWGTRGVNSALTGHNAYLVPSAPNLKVLVIFTNLDNFDFNLLIVLIAASQPQH